MNNQPLLTVIVPCYNVEKYIDKCLLSIVGQIYTNLEILLINDGSTDNTGMICDTWQEKDSRIRVINKQNEGLAYARKTGLEHSTGEFIAFVDPDDWIDTNMYTDMMSALLTTNSDIAMSNYCRVFEDGSMQKSINRQEINKTMNRVEAMTMILNDSDCTSFCIYIFKKTLFADVVFHKGRGYAEDLIIHQLFHRISQAVYLDREYYYYLQRKDSITKSNNIQTEMKNYSDFSDAYYERYYFVNRHPEYHNALPFVKFMTTSLGLNLLRNIVVYPQHFSKEYFHIKAKQMRTISLTSNDDIVQRSLRIDLYLLKINPKWYKFIRSLYVSIIHIANHIKITNRKTSSPHYYSIVLLGKKNFKR